MFVQHVLACRDIPITVNRPNKDIIRHLSKFASQSNQCLGPKGQSTVILAGAIALSTQDAGTDQSKPSLGAGLDIVNIFRRLLGRRGEASNASANNSDRSRPARAC